MSDKESLKHVVTVELPAGEEFGGPVQKITEALIGERGPDQQRIAEVGVQWVRTLLDKNADYGGSVWDQPVLAPDVQRDAAIRVRMSDKVQRLSNLLSQRRVSDMVSYDAIAEPQISDETIEDTVGDLGAYCLLWLAKPQ